MNCAAPVSGHELPDGEIERRVQIVVKPDSILIEYSTANIVYFEKQLLDHHRRNDLARRGNSS